MKLAIMQPYFMPYIGYFQAIAAVDKYILYDHLAYIVNGWINTNRVRQRNMPECDIVVPVQQKSSYKLIAETEIDNSKPWKSKILKTLQLGYAKSAYYKEVMPLIEDIISREYTGISELNAVSIRKICEYLDIKTHIVSDCSQYFQIEEKLQAIDNADYSSLPYMEATKPIRKVARVIAICRQENADTFINAIGGTALYNKQEFSKYGINLQFVKTNDICYDQNCKDGSFIPNLSIIDVLMHNGKEKTKMLLNEYSLV